MIQAQLSYEDIDDPDPWLTYLPDTLNSIFQHKIWKKFDSNSVVSIVFIHDKHMKELNNQFRKKNKTTDVLSFPIMEKNPESFMIGEIIISLDKARVDAKELGISFEKEIFRLIVHGLLHLLGYDHGSDLEEKEMKSMEKNFLHRLTFLRGA